MSSTTVTKHYTSATTSPNGLCTVRMGQRQTTMVMFEGWHNKSNPINIVLELMDINNNRSNLESVDSLCRDGADAQYMQYLSKSHITSPQIC